MADKPQEQSRPTEDLIMKPAADFFMHFDEYKDKASEDMIINKA